MASKRWQEFPVLNPHSKYLKESFKGRFLVSTHRNNKINSGCTLLLSRTFELN